MTRSRSLIVIGMDSSDTRRSTTLPICSRTPSLFSDLSWFYIFEGMGLRPQRTDPLLDFIPVDRLRDILAQLAQSVSRASAAAPSHDSLFADGVARFRRPAGTGIRAVTSS